MNKASLSSKLYPILSAIGYYKIKSSIKQHSYYKRLVAEDNEKKSTILNNLLLLSEPVHFGDNDIIISLTSYGDRIANSLPFTLSSLLVQEIMPNKICVFIGNNEFTSIEDLPDILIHLSKLGIIFKFVEDTKSYKKLIPALELFPNNPILTVDDDMYYSKDFFHLFYKAYLKSDRKTVFGTAGRYEVKGADGKYLPYSQWTDYRSGEGDSISFYGCGGCLYPPHIFDDEIFKSEIFSEVAPIADDLWFWAMEKRMGINRALLSSKTIICEPVNRIEMFIQDGTLTYQNDILKKNDLQLRAILERYQL